MIDIIMKSDSLLQYENLQLFEKMSTWTLLEFYSRWYFCSFVPPLVFMELLICLLLAYALLVLFYFAFSHHVFSEARWDSSAVQDRWNWGALCLCSCHRNIILWSLWHDQEHLWGRLMEKFLSSVLSLAVASNIFAKCSETEKKPTKMMIFQRAFILVKLVAFSYYIFVFDNWIINIILTFGQCPGRINSFFKMGVLFVVYLSRWMIFKKHICDRRMCA